MSANKNSVVGGFARAVLYCAVPWHDAVCRLARRRFVDEPAWHRSRDRLADWTECSSRPFLHGEPWSLPIANAAPIDRAARPAFRQQQLQAMALARHRLAAGRPGYVADRSARLEPHRREHCYFRAGDVPDSSYRYSCEAGARLWSASVVLLFVWREFSWDVLPPLLNSSMKENVSWEGHLSGAISGAIAAWRVRKK